MLRCGVLVIVFAVAIGVDGGAQDLTSSWYPLHPGDSWTYQKESLDGNIDHPSVERWTTEETIIKSENLSGNDGTFVTKRTRVLDHTLPPGFIAANDSTRRELAESHLLIYRDCIYFLDGIDAQGAACDPNVDSVCLRPLDSKSELRSTYRDDLVRGQVPADLCFPIVVGGTWGRIRTTSPAGEWVWNVTGFNAGSIGPPESGTFHLLSHLGSGTNIDRWFSKGVGIVQEVILHHGTYEEQRRSLVKTVIAGTTTDYKLTPGRPVPLSEWDCRGNGWQHYSPENGMPFRDATDCLSYISNRK